jgi:hypothetical protein
MQAEHMNVVKEIMEFCYRKRRRGLRVCLYQVEWRHRVQEKEFYFRSFYIILNLEVGRKCITPHLQGLGLEGRAGAQLWVGAQGEDLGELMHTSMLILRYPQSIQEEFLP